MKTLSPELKVGIFAIAVILAISYMTFKVGDFTLGLEKGYRLYAEFGDISGLDEKSRVKVAGVKAGIVEKIQLVEGKARITLLMDPRVKIYKDAAASLKVTGLLGDKYLALWPGSPQEPLLKDGDTISNIKLSADMDVLANKLILAAERMSNLAESLNEILGTSKDRDAMRTTIGNLRDVTENLNQSIIANDVKLRKVLDNIEKLTASLNNLLKENKGSVSSAIAKLEDFSNTLQEKGPALIDDLSSAARELKSIVEESKPAVKDSVENIKEASASIDRIAQKIDRGEGTIGRLFKDEKLYESLNDAAGGISKTLSAVERLRTFIQFRTEYLTKDSDWKGYFDVTLQPKKDKYYILGVVRDPRGSIEVTETTINGITTKEEKIEEKLEFTAQFAKRFKDLALRVGMTESTFGIGADYFFKDDTIKISTDAWDFNADEAMAKKAHAKIGIDYRVFRYLFISGGIDNLLDNSRRGVYVGGGLKFEDKDFKYLLSVSPQIPVR